MGGHHAQVVGQRTETVGGRRGRGAAAQALGAQVGRRLLDIQGVAISQRGEQVDRVVRGDRQPPVIGTEPAQQRRHGLGRLVRHCDRVGVPRGVAGQRGQIGEPAGVDSPAAIGQRGTRQLVEHDHHHGGGPAHFAGRRRLLVLREHEIGHRGDKEKEPGEQERRRAEHRQNRRHHPRARVPGHTGRADREGPDDEDDPGTAHPVGERLERNRRDQQAHERKVQPAPSGGEANQQRLAQRERRRRHEGDREREEHDVGAGVAAGDEELRLVGQDVEERLGDRERPEDREVKPGEEEHTRRGRRLAAGR